MSDTKAFKPGDLARLVQTRGYVTKTQAGRLVTVRSVHPPDKYGDEAVVDDGAPLDADHMTNGARLWMCLPLRALGPVGDVGHEAKKMRREAARLLAMADAVEVPRG